MYSSILIPIDLADQEHVQGAIAAARSFARGSGLKTPDARIRLVHVRPLVPMTYMEFVPPTFDEEQQGASEGELAKIAAGLGLPAERVSTRVLSGSIHGEILREAESWGADLIVVWSHRPGLAAYLIGSNAATIVRHAACSVLVVRASATPAPGPSPAAAAG